MPQSTDVTSVPDSLIGEELRFEAFSQLAGNLSGYPFVKVVVDSGIEPSLRRKAGILHVMNHSVYPFHAHYIAEKILRVPIAQVEASIDQFNQSVYLDPSRRFFLGIISLHRLAERRFFVLETVEIDTMDEPMLRYFFSFLRTHLDPSIPLFFKPANHQQEQIVSRISPAELPRIFNHELFASSSFVPLNAAKATGRLRVFRSTEEFRASLPTIQWFDILVMHRVPDDMPRVSGVINAHHTTPLSHTNVLASGWGIPNCTQIGVIDQIARDALDGQWVEYSVDANASQLSLKKIEKPAEITRPAWSVQHIKLEEPEALNTKIQELSTLRMSDRYKFGTKAANLGELKRAIEEGSERLAGFYRVSRPPRDHLLPYLAKFLGVDEAADLSDAIRAFLKRDFSVPRGIAIPFSIQQEFLESSPRIQQAIGKLKMAIELDAREIDSLALSLQKLIVGTRLPDRVRGYIDSQIARHLAGVSSFVVRSSSNAEDLENFSAAGIYESITHVSQAESIFESVKQVWASLVSPRSVRLRSEVGISLDESYMGVIVQEEVKASLGGVLVTTNPMSRGDFRNVYVNVSTHSVQSVVEGAELPLQYLYNTVEGGGRTLSLGSAHEDLGLSVKERLQKLAFAGRLLQSHFAPDYTFSAPVDIEWAMTDEKILLLQLRPYASGNRSPKK
ncbi:MAG: hypothetical protein RJB38_1029 [Pseudomonadota bacterium]|jgi:hypothetical protein